VQPLQDRKVKYVSKVLLGDALYPKLLYLACNLKQFLDCFALYYLITESEGLLVQTTFLNYPCKKNRGNFFYMRQGSLPRETTNCTSRVGQKCLQHMGKEKKKKKSILCI